MSGPVDPLDAYPARADLAWDEVDGRVVVALPHPHGPIERLVARILPVPTIRLVSLEGPTALAWTLCDGTRAGREVAAALPDAVPEREARVARFLLDRAAEGWLSLREAPGPVKDAWRGFTAERGWRLVACRRCRTRHPLRLAPGERFFCPRCRRLNQVPLAPGARSEPA